MIFWVSPRLFWAVLAVAILALLAMIVRLLKKESVSAGTRRGEADTDLPSP
jgi:hypothetical protein